MEKRVGSSAGILALIAVMFHSFMPSSTERAGSATSEKAPAEAHADAKPEVGAKSVPVQGPWLASRQYFHREPPADFKTTCIDYLLPPIRTDVFCSPDALRELFGLDETFHAPELTTLVVTIPDPLHTRMSMAADRDLDAVQRAAFDSDWELATQWLPWSVQARTISDDSKDETVIHLDPEKLPGLIVFRRKFTQPAVQNKLLFMFVVGENPASGLNGFQFEGARRCIEVLTGAPRISVLGPRFSGSFLSLTKLIEADGKHGYDIHSGSVSNSGYASSMLGAMANSHDVTFHGSTLPSGSSDAQFRRLAKEQGFSVDQIANLIEDGSGFSVGVERANGDQDADIKTFFYPRDIAQLRDAYSDVAFANPLKTGAKGAQSPQLVLKDTGTGESEFPMFSASHTPVSQNLVLEQVVNEIRNQRIRLISLSATNVFDVLFITNVLASKCPDVRVVLSGADLLFVQQAAQNSLSGLLAISPFPMFPNGFRWEDALSETALRRGAALRRGTTFADTDSVGEYNAALALLGKPNSDPLPFAPPSPEKKDMFASAWILVLGRSGWAPIDLLDQQNPTLKERTKKLPPKTWFDESQKPKPESLAITPPPVSASWKILCLLTTLLCLFFCGRFIYLRLRPNLRVWSILCSVDLQPGPNMSRLAHVRYLCLLSCFGTLAFLNGLLLFPMLEGGIRDWPLKVLLASGVTVPLLSQCFVSLRISKNAEAADEEVPSKKEGDTPADEAPPTRRFLYGSLAVRVLLLLLPITCLIFWYELCFEQGLRGTFFRYRTLSLSFPVCPVWPPLLATLGIFVIAVLHLRRLTWASRQRPILETSTLDRSLWGQLGKLNDALGRAFSGPAASRPGVRAAGAAAILCVFAMLVIVFPDDSLKSFEPRAYERILLLLVLPLSLLVASSFARFAFSWHILRRLLTMLNSLAIARFFKRLPDFDGSGPIWVRDLKLTSLASSVNSAIALHNLDLLMPHPQLKAEGYWAALEQFLSLKPERDRGKVLKQYRSFARKAAEVSRTASEQVLQPFWQAQRIPFVEAGHESHVETHVPLARSATVGGTSHLIASVGPPAQPTDEEGYEMASEYVALQYSVFIGYALRHIQNLLLCSVLSFVLLVVALNSFSFQTEAISRLLLAGLVAGGIVVVRALAQIERNPIISRISGTEEGTLGKDFYLQIITYGALPVMAVLGTQFPSVARLVSSWAQPTLEVLK